MAHIHLYTAYGALGTGATVLFWATAGDVLYALLGVAVVSALFSDLEWLEHPRTLHFAMAALYGFCISIFIEWKALILHKWAYTTAMPLLPVIHVGVSPVLQMTLLMPVSVWCLQHVYKFKIYRNYERI
jgi:hypothetical protein